MQAANLTLTLTNWGTKFKELLKKLNRPWVYSTSLQSIKKYIFIFLKHFFLPPPPTNQQIQYKI